MIDIELVEPFVYADDFKIEACDTTALKRRYRQHIARLKRTYKRKIQDLSKEIIKLTEEESKPTKDVDYTCKLCYSNNINTVLSCEHGFCEKCVEKLDKCPLCRKVKNSYYKIKNI
jgi:hypothetical protein